MTGWSSKQWMALGTFLALSSSICIQPAAAAWSGTEWGQIVSLKPNGRAAPANMASFSAKFNQFAFVTGYRRGGIPLQCVPFARENSGIALVGNAATWWNSAVGVYERGNRPEVGSVLNFRATGRMRLGHVAVVSRIIDARNVEIDHANWSHPGGISRNINVVDVSPRNDWTAVRVALSRSNEFGSIYPTYGFIYDRPDHGTMVANVDTVPAPVLNLPPSDLRPANVRVVASSEPEEVAEAADDTTTRRAPYARARLGKSPNGATMRRVATVANGRRADPAR